MMYTLTENIIQKALDLGLTEREIMIVMDRARGVTFREIAEDEGVSPERIRQIEARALRKLAKSL